MTCLADFLGKGDGNARDHHGDGMHNRGGRVGREGREFHRITNLLEKLVLTQSGDKETSTLSRVQYSLKKK